MEWLKNFIFAIDKPKKVCYNGSVKRVYLLKLLVIMLFHLHFSAVAGDCKWQ